MPFILPKGKDLLLETPNSTHTLIDYKRRTKEMEIGTIDRMNRLPSLTLSIVPVAQHMLAKEGLKASFVPIVIPLDGGNMVSNILNRLLLERRLTSK